MKNQLLNFHLKRIGFYELNVFRPLSTIRRTFLKLKASILNNSTPLSHNVTFKADAPSSGAHGV